MDTIIQSLKSPGKRGTYQRHSLEFKRAVVAELHATGASVARTARKHNVNANQLFAWRKLFDEPNPATGSQMACTLLPITVGTPAADPAPPSSTHGATSTGTITLRVGLSEVRIEGSIDPAMLTLVLAHLLP